MKPKVLIPFIVVLIVLGGIALITQNQQSTPSIVEQVDLDRLVDESIEADSIDRIEMFAAANPDEKLVLARADEDWVVASKFNAPATDSKVDDFLDDLVNLKGEFRADAETDEAKAEFQLADDSAFRVQAFTGEGDEPAIDVFVGKAPSRSNVFMRKAGEDSVYVEAVNLRQQAGVYGEDFDAAPKPDSWLDKVAVDLDKDTITKVAATYPDKSWVVEKKAVETEAPAEKSAEDTEETEGETEEAAPTEPEVTYAWALVEGGVDDTFKQPGLDKVLNSLNSLRATDVVDPETPGEWGLEEPGFKLTVSREEEDDLTIEGGRPDPASDGYIRVGGEDATVVYKLSKFTFEQLFPKGSDLFDLPQLSLAENQIDRIALEAPDGRFVAMKQGDAWTIAEPAVDLPVQTTKLETLAKTVASLQAGDYADSAEGPFDTKLMVQAGGVTKTIQLGGEAESFDGSYAKIDGVDTVVALKKADITKIFLEPNDVFELKVVDLNADGVAGLYVRSGEHDLKFARDGGMWKLEGGGEAASEKVDDFLADLIALEAVDFVVDDETVEGDAAASIGLRVGDDEMRFITIGPEKNGKHRVSKSDGNLTFVVARADVNRLTNQIPALKPEPAEDTVDEPAAAEAADASDEMLDEAAEAPAEAAEAPAETRKEAAAEGDSVESTPEVTTEAAASPAE